MKALRAKDTLTSLLMRVSAWSRPRQSRGTPDTVYAVFSDQADEGLGSFMGLVTSQRIARFPDRIFADLVPLTTQAVISADSGLDEVEARFADPELTALPVAQDGRFIGAVTRESLLSALLRRDRLLIEQMQVLRESLEADRSRLARWSEQLRSLHEISHGLLDMLSRNDDVYALMQSGIESLRKLIGFRYGAIGIADESGRIAHFLHCGLDDESVLRLGQPPGAIGVLGELLRSRDMPRVDGVQGDPCAGFPLHHPLMKRVVAAPIAYHGRVLGHVYLCDKESGAALTDHDSLLTLTFANTLASLLVNAEEQARRRDAEREAGRLLAENQRLSRHLLGVLEEERRYIARELHDEMGQCVTAIQAEAETINVLSAGFDPRIHQCASSISELGSRLYNGVHAMLRRLRPELLDDLGLSEAVRYIVCTWQAHYPHVQCRLRLGEGLDDLDEMVGIVIYRVVQECLTNVARHSQATAIVLRLSRRHGPDGERLSLKVRDNGRGLTRKRVGLGLVGLRERVETLGGRLCIRSPGRGTCVQVHIPVQSAADTLSDGRYPVAGVS